MAASLLALSVLGGASALLVARRTLQRVAPYPIDPEAPWGPHWGEERPPGLPEGARRSSRRGAALPDVERYARATGLGPAFVQTMIDLAENESGGTYARPANIFDARPGTSRLITAWGVFNYNKGALERAAGRELMPWDTSPAEEITIPFREYMRVWRAAKSAGAPDRYTALAVWLWHSAPGLVEPYIARGARGSWSQAWAGVPAEITLRDGRTVPLRSRVASKVRLA